MELKNNKGYSMIEIAVGLILITVFLVVIYTILISSYSNYRKIEQRNVATKYAVKYVEQLLSMKITSLSASELNSGSNISYTTSGGEITEISMPYAYADVYAAVLKEPPSVTELSEGNYAIPADFIVPNTGKMIVTVSLRRLPGSFNNESYIVYNSGILIINVDVKYKIRTSDKEYKTFNLKALKITKEEDLL